MKEVYRNPLVERYASPEMGFIFSSLNKYSVWHDLWIALAESQKELGLSITDEQIGEMKANRGKIDFEKVRVYEKETRHEVIAHIWGWGDICPKARPILHLGATSAFVMDNGDLIQMYQALELILKRLVNLFQSMAHFAERYKDMPTLSYTHFQPAQLTTVGKRAVLWLYDLFLDYEDLIFRLKNRKIRGVKGTVGTQDSFMKLFENDEAKVRELDERIARKMGFPASVPVSGQTYSRKIDYLIFTSLSNLAQSAHKIATDIRLLQGLQELEEPFGKNQVGSSAMPYKRNPMKSERVCSLARFVIQSVDTVSMNHAVQWLERSLDDSANRRIVIPEAFLAMDAILLILTNIFEGLQVCPKMVERRIQANLPFLTAEYVIMESVKKGQDRQDVHEAFREKAMEAISEMKEKGRESDLIRKLADSSKIALSEGELRKILDPSQMTGRAASQVDEFLKTFIRPVLKKHRDLLEGDFIDLKV